MSGPRYSYYDRDRDELVYPNGLRVRRPQEIPIESFTVQRTTPRTSSQPWQHYQRSPQPQSPSADQNYTYYAVQSSGYGPAYSVLPSHVVPQDTGQAPSAYVASASLTGNTSHFSNNAREQPPDSFASHPGPASSLGAPFSYAPNPTQPVRVVRKRRPSHNVVPKVYRTGASIQVDGPSAPEDGTKLKSEFKQKKSPRKFFVFGKVFTTLWSEPAGDAGEVSGSASGYTAMTSNFSEVRFGERVHSKIRRFIVIREGHESCTALPVTTYTGQGVARSGVRKSDHAIIYTGKQPPSPDPQELPERGERGMQTEAIRIDADIPTEKLDPMSRVNFSKVYTIEHNVKVKSLGKVNRASEQSLKYQFDAVWAETVGSTQQPNQPDEASEPMPDVAEWVDAYQTLVDSGFSEERARAILRPLPDHLLHVRSDLQADEDDDDDDDNNNVNEAASNDS